MKKTVWLMSLVFFLIFTDAPAADSPVGKWKTFDHETQKAMSIVEVYEDGGKINGVIIELLREKEGGKGILCRKCTGADFNKPIVGMVIMKGLKANGNEYGGGTIMDPGTGKTYRCKIEIVEGGTKLKVRGYVGISLAGQNQFWQRVQ